MAAAARRSAAPLTSFALDGTECRLGRVRHPDDRSARRRRLRPQRLEDVHHERRLCRLVHGVRLDRQVTRPPRVVGVRRPDRPRRRRGRQAPRQDGPALDRHVRAVVPGRSRSRREPARRGGRGLQDRDEDARLHAARHRDRRRRRRARGVRVRGRVLEGARPVRHADRDEPGRQLPDRRHGDEDRGGAAALLAGGVDARQRACARDAAVVVREALRRRHLRWR